MKQSAEWDSFEQLRVRPGEQLNRVAPRTYARLRIKHQHLVVLNATDFEALTRATNLSNLSEDVELLEAIVPVLDPKAQHLLEMALRRLRGTLNVMTFHAHDAGMGEG